MARQLDESNQFIFTWKIRNINILWRCQSNSLKSPSFYVCNKASWYLKISNDGIIHINKISDHDDGNSIISYKLEILDGFGDLLVSCQFENCSLTKHNWKNKCYIILPGFQSITKAKAVTIQLFLILPDMITNDIYRFKAQTEYKVERSSFVWIVERFLLDDQDSRIFTCSEWVDLYVKLSKSERFVKINIETLKQEHLFCYLDCKIALLDIDEEEIISETGECVLILPERCWKFPDFIETRDLMYGNSKCRSYNTFSLKFEFYVSSGATFEDEYYCTETRSYDSETYGSYSINSSNSEDTNYVDSVADLQENFRRMYVEQLQTDVKLQAGKQEYHAHKFVLSARSPVLATILSNQSVLENPTSVLDIPDVEPEILDIFLRFMYDGIVNSMDYDSASKLLVAADKYQVPNLKQKCFDFLISNLDDENVCDVLLLAHKIEHNTLKSSAVDYIAEHADAILITKEWSQFLKSNMDLAIHVMGELSFLYSSNKSICK